ncbi:MAG: hypothetical protein NTV58_14505 [Deltaproteobacteria bacterium]|nr:hypothetical protein [Deltaproteobacteria bacterium]
MASKTEMSITVNVLIKKEANYFLAHCLELDIVATANSAEEVEKEIIDLIDAQVDYAFAHGNLDNLYHPAPLEVWKDFYKCKEARERKSKVESRFTGDSLESFVPPWVIANMCMAECHV